LKIALQNLELNGGNVEYEWIKPFDKVSEYASCQAWLRIVDDVRRCLVGNGAANLAV